MREICTYGSVRGASGNRCPYRDPDLFVAEAYFFEKKVKLHLDLQTLEEKLPLIGAKRLVLTHMSDDMLGRLETLPYETAHDGLVLQF